MGMGGWAWMGQFTLAQFRDGRDWQMGMGMDE